MSKSEQPFFKHVPGVDRVSANQTLEQTFAKLKRQVLVIRSVGDIPDHMTFVAYKAHVRSLLRKTNELLENKLSPDEVNLAYNIITEGEKIFFGTED